MEVLNIFGRPKVRFAEISLRWMMIVSVACGVRIRFPFTVHTLRLSSRTFAREFVELRPERKADSPAEARPWPGWKQSCPLCPRSLASSVLQTQTQLGNFQYSVLRTLKHNIFVWSLPRAMALSSWCLNRMSCRNLHSIKLNCREQTQGDTISEEILRILSSLRKFSF